MKEKNRYGQYFTINDMAKFMVGLIRHEKDSSVLEPSCGKGVFLSNLSEAGYANVSAYEIDRSLGNPFPYVKYESFITSPCDKYDVVIGNPPYIRWKNLEPELKEELASSVLWNKYFNSLCDYLFIFILKSIEQLNDGGELIFICTEYWMNTTNSDAFRDYMVENGYFSEIYHFKEARLFEGVCASFVVFRYVKSKPAKPIIKLYRYNSDVTPCYEDLVSGKCFDVEDIPQFEKKKRWLLASSAQQNNLISFESHCKISTEDLFDTGRLMRVGDVCDIGNGMVSGLDKAFNVTSLDNLSMKESSYVIKVLKAKDLGAYKHVSESRYCFITEQMTRKDFEEYCPAFFNHFLPYETDLNGRYSYGREIPFWEFVFPRNYNLFSRHEKRIMVPCKERISNKDHFRFVLADSDYFPLQDVTAVLKKSSCRESIEYIVAYLNSKRVFDWLKYNGIVKGYIVEFSEAPIASIPYRSIDWENNHEVALHDSISSAVTEYISSGERKCLEDIDDAFNRLFN